MIRTGPAGSMWRLKKDQFSLHLNLVRLLGGIGWLQTQAIALRHEAVKYMKMINGWFPSRMLLDGTVSMQLMPAAFLSLLRYLLLFFLIAAGTAPFVHCVLCSIDFDFLSSTHLSEPILCYSENSSKCFINFADGTHIWSGKEPYAKQPNQSFVLQFNHLKWDTAKYKKFDWFCVWTY